MVLFFRAPTSWLGAVRVSHGRARQHSKEEKMEDDLNQALSSHGLIVSSSLPAKGRGLLSTKDFYPGDVIFFQNPYACVLSTPSCCDGCFLSAKLKRCSSCQIARYCGTSCQKSEWKLHQLECQALVGLSESRRNMLTPTMRLMVKLLLRKKLQNDKIIQSFVTDNYGLVEALISHMPDIDEKQLVLYAQMANLIKLVIPFMEINVKEVTENFSRLACNAHTICDSELRPIGTGIYPLISIINHSCLPNSILMFEGRTAIVRAVEHIPKGTEVLISYIETASTTIERKRILKEQYFFNCACERCTRDNACRGLLEDAILGGYCCKDKKCNGALLLDSEKEVYRCQTCGLSQDQQELEKITSEIKLVSLRASRCLSEANHMEASVLYKNLEQLQLKVYHPLSVNLMRTREDIMKIMMEWKDWRGALAYCRLTIPVYQGVYPTIHPMPGLQYYMCGKLEWLVGETGNALKSLTKAVDVLHITHGTNTPFMRDLINRLEEARAEDAFSCRLTN